MKPIIVEAWPGCLGGVAIRRAAARRITAVTAVATVAVVLCALVLRWPLRGACAGILFAQAGGIIARLYLAHESLVHVVPAESGVLLVRGARARWFVAYADIATTLDDGPDVCIVLENGGRIRIGLDSDDGARLAAVRIKTKLSRRA